MTRCRVSPRRATVLLAALVSLVCGRSLAEEEETGPQWEMFVKTILGFTNLSGRVSARKLTYRKFPPLTDARGRVRIVKKHWWFENVTGDMCGGRASGDVDIKFLKKDRRLRLHLTVVAAKLEEVTRFFNYTVMDGNLSGKLSLSATSDKSKLHGRAELTLRNADLGELPLALKAISFMFLKFPELQKQKISQADGDLTITPRGLVFQNLSLSTDDGGFSLVAERLGTISYEGNIDAYFRAVFAAGIGDAIPIVAQFLDFIGSRGGRVHVTGTIFDPEFSWAAFR